MTNDVATMDERMLEFLCCPVSHRPLTPARSELIDQLNKAVERGDLLYVNGEPVTEPLQAGLATDDEQVVYAVADDIPVLLPESGIGTLQLK